MDADVGAVFFRWSPDRNFRPQDLPYCPGSRASAFHAMTYLIGRFTTLALQSMWPHVAPAGQLERYRLNLALVSIAYR
jgi:hypothetical protein